MAELAESRAENARLRGLLGLDRRAENVSVARWSPSLFSEQHAGAEAKIIKIGEPVSASTCVVTKGAKLGQSSLEPGTKFKF